MTKFGESILGWFEPTKILNMQQPPLPEARFDLELEMYPLTIEALHHKTGIVVWSQSVEAKPPASQRIHVPALRKQLGHPVRIRVTFADGSVRECAEVYEN